MSPLKLVVSQSDNPSANLAWEEYFLKNSHEDYLLFYVNRPSVIIGKHQNPWREVNLSFCKKNNIDIHRRLSGGGAVYHDFNNINFSYIRSKPTDFVNFKEHITPISMALKQLGVNNHITERNDIFIDDKKISGNAEHVDNTRKRILHHGTLLCDSDLYKLRAALKTEIEGINTHAVDSVRSSVTTISEHLKGHTTQEILEKLIASISNQLKLDSKNEFDPSTQPEIQKLIRDKFNQWDWNYGHSPQFEYKTNQHSVTVRRGKITAISSTAYSEDQISNLIGQRYRKQDLYNIAKEDLHNLIQEICLDS
ncbi:MAG: lipoate--protein ligase [Bacteroidia bacterium]